MRAALLALGQALVDAIAVGLVGDDEDAAFGGCSRRGDERNAQANERGMDRMMHRKMRGKCPQR